MMFVNTSENFTTLSNESLQTLSSVYNADTLSVNNVTSLKTISTKTLTTSSDSTIGGDLIITGNIKPSNTNTTTNPNGINLNGRLSVADKIKTNNIAITGSLCVGADDNKSICLQSNELFQMMKFYKQKDRMYNNGAIIYQNIFDALNTNIIAKNGAPVGWDQTNWLSKLWNGYPILNIGNGVNTGINGLKINIASLAKTDSFTNGFGQLDQFDDYSRVIWVRVLSDRFFSVKLMDDNGVLVNSFASGKRNLTSINPNGNQNDSGYAYAHQWVPIAIPSPIKTNYYLVSQDKSDTWISGIAFSKNPWNHAMNSALAYAWAVNGGTATTWESDNWNNDVLSKFVNGTTYTLNVPIVWSQYDKLVYFIEYNNNWNGGSHKKVTANGVQIENFSSTFTNPFATHINSKMYNRYFATKIPNNLIKQGDKTVTLTIDMTGCNEPIYFREIGTHDYI